jgi:hypothetical protein
LASDDGLGLLANVGIVAGRPFEPDAETRAILNAAAKTAYKMSPVIGRMSEIGGRDLMVWKDRKWVNPINNISEPGSDKTLDLAWRNKKAGFTEIEPRVWMFTDYYSISPGVVSLTPGRGAFYAIAFDDSEGKPLSGDVYYKVDAAAQRAGQALLVADPLRVGKRFRPGDRSAALPLTRVAWQPGEKQRWHDRPLHRSKASRRQGSQLACNGARAGLLLNPAALWPGGGCHQL